MAGSPSPESGLTRCSTTSAVGAQAKSPPQGLSDRPGQLAAFALYDKKPQAHGGAKIV